MPTIEEHKRKANLAYEAHQCLATNQHYDWAIIAMFYQALHLVDAYLANQNIHPERHETHRTDRGAILGRNEYVDAPIYLDKPLKEHRLLQAIARTNRPYKDLKEAGIVIDYVGILKEFEKAFEIYSEADIKGALFSYDSAKGEFATLIKEILEIFRSWEVPRDYERATLLKAIEVLTSDTVYDD